MSMFLSSVVLAGSLLLNRECRDVGLIYQIAAEQRDQGLTREKAMIGASMPETKLAIEHVYGSPDITPRQWYFFMAGVCEGTINKEKNSA